MPFLFSKRTLQPPTVPKPQQNGLLTNLPDLNPTANLWSIVKLKINTWAKYTDKLKADIKIICASVVAEADHIHIDAVIRGKGYECLAFFN